MPPSMSSYPVRSPSSRRPLHHSICLHEQQFLCSNMDSTTIHAAYMHIEHSLSNEVYLKSIIVPSSLLYSTSIYAVRWIPHGSTARQSSGDKIFCGGLQ